MTVELERWVEARPGAPERRADQAPDNFAPAKHAFRAQGPDAAQLQRMLERLAAQGTSGTAAQSNQAGASAGARALLGRLGPVLGLLVSGALVIGLTRLSLVPVPQRAPRPATVVQVQIAAAPVTRSLAPDAPPARAVPPAGVSSLARLRARFAPPSQVSPEAPSHPAAARTTSVPLRGPQRAPVAAPQVDPLGELSLLQRARRILLADPERALALTDEHRVTYRDGVLVEERELLATEALLRLGKRRAASERAQSFRRLFPRSVHNTRLDTLLEAHPF